MGVLLGFLGVAFFTYSIMCAIVGFSNNAFEWNGFPEDNIFELVISVIGSFLMGIGSFFSISALK